jgi:ribosomal protein S12 methylthiotransferase
MLEEGTLKKKSFVEIPKYIHTEADPRMHTTPSHMAWLKVSEGCNRNCTFCIIPTLRGKLRSRTVESLITEARDLTSKGVLELNIISQDLSDYGVDLEKDDLFELIKGLEEKSGAAWIRLFYYYPDDLTEEIMMYLASAKNICPYLDMPVQHFSSSVLKRMNRKVTGEQIKAKIKRLREFIPGITLRSSVIVGFPGETTKDFEELLQGIKEVEFDHLGVFKYSDEEGTPACKLFPKVDPETINDRFNQVYEIQREIVAQKNEKYVGQILEVLVEGPHEETDLLLQGRHRGQAPDIDGKVIINEGHAESGSIVKVEILEVLDYDLLGRIVSGPFLH